MDTRFVLTGRTGKSSGTSDFQHHGKVCKLVCAQFESEGLERVVKNYVLDLVKIIRWGNRGRRRRSGREGGHFHNGNYTRCCAAGGLLVFRFVVERRRGAAPGVSDNHSVLIPQNHSHASSNIMSSSMAAAIMDT